MENQEILKVLQDIKKLLALGLLKNGLNTEDIANLFGVSTKTIERLVPRNHPRKKAK